MKTMHASKDKNFEDKFDRTYEIVTYLPIAAEKLDKKDYGLLRKLVFLECAARLGPETFRTLYDADAFGVLEEAALKQEAGRPPVRASALINLMAGLSVDEVRQIEIDKELSKPFEHRSSKGKGKEEKQRRDKARKRVDRALADLPEEFQYLLKRGCIPAVHVLFDELEQAVLRGDVEISNGDDTLAESWGTTEALEEWSA